MSEENGGLAAALAKFQGEMTSVPKTKTANAGSYSYKYADLGDVVAKAYPIMSRHGLSFSARPTLNGDGHLVLAYKLMHASGEFEEGEYPLPSNGNPQQMGSAITYARRYTFCAITGAVAEEDDDGKAAPAEAQPTSRARKQAQPRKQVAGMDVAPETEAALTAAAQRRKYHALRAELGWDEEAGHGFIVDKSRGNATRWTDLDERGRSYILGLMQEYADAQNEGPNFPEHGEYPQQADEM